MRASSTFVVALVLFLAGCASSVSTDPFVLSEAATMVDPLALGASVFTRLEYDFGMYIVDDPELVVYQYAVPVHGSLHLPVGTTPAPVILLLHGRHGTCALLGVETAGPGTCPNATVITPVNSFNGYDGLAANLASHGYAVASVDANTINDRDLIGDSGANARAELLLHTLDQLASVNATGRSLSDLGTQQTVLSRMEIPQAKGRLDLSRVGMMGHSRGGEGVARAVSLDAEQGGTHGLDAVFALAPTDFGRWPIAGVPFATLLPYCDGDVFDLEGAWMFDDARSLLPAAPRHQILAMGANHNFYNTVWTFNDGGIQGEWCGSEESGSGRDSAASQRAHGNGIMAAFFRFYVGHETAFGPLWAGTAPWPDSFCPERDGCVGRLWTSHMPVDAMVLARDGKPDATNLAVSSCMPDKGGSCPGDPTYSIAAQSVWKCMPGGVAQFMAPGGINGRTAITMRVGNTIDTDLKVWADTGDGAMHLADLPARPGGKENGKTVLNEIRFPLPAVDLSGFDVVTIHCDGDGTIQVADVMVV